MGSSRFALGFVGLALAGLWYVAGGADALPVADSPRVEEPLTHANLSVYLIRGADAVAESNVLTLQEALERHLAVVHETSNVNVLAVENTSAEYELFIQSGDIVKGGQQDRVVAGDMLLPPKSGVVPLPAHCVEQGRWAGRGGESARQFASSEKCAAGKDLKYANATGQQAAVWQNVSANQAKLNDNLKAVVNSPASPTSFQLTLEAPAVQAKVAEYEAALKGCAAGRRDVIGAVFVVNGQVTGAEVYGSNALFRKAWPKLLNAAAVEAIAEQKDTAAAAPLAVDAVEQFLARAAEPAARDRTNSAGAGGTEELTAGQRQALQGGRGLLDNVYARRAGAVAGEAANEPPQVVASLPQIERLAPRDAMTAYAPATALVLPAAPPLPPSPPALGSPDAPAPDRVGRVALGAGAATANTYENPVATGTPPAAQPADGRVVAQVPAPGPLASNSPLPAPAPTDNRQVFNFSVGVFGERTTSAPAQPVANPSGNRLNSNRAENDAALTVESRDPARKNAVIHRSYIKK